MILSSADFVKSATRPANYPDSDLPEIAFAGRSNVGKSSLINTLLNRKHLVKTSCTPGRTQLLNFFLINESFMFVDLPGFGYAKVSMSVRKNWKPMIETYITSRKNLKAVVLILDVRRTPQAEEADLIAWLNGIYLPPIPILTKSDKLSKTKSINQRNTASRILGIEPDDFILFSSKTRSGRELLWERLEHLIF